jgi:hypothetical protein
VWTISPPLPYPYEPVDAREDRAAHGRFDDEAGPRSLQLALTKRRGALAVGAVAVGAALLARRAVS